MSKRFVLAAPVIRLLFSSVAACCRQRVTLWTETDRCVVCFSRQRAHGATAVERNCELMNVLLDCNKNGDVTSGFVTSYQQVRFSSVFQAKQFILRNIMLFFPFWRSTRVTDRPTDRILITTSRYLQVGVRASCLYQTVNKYNNIPVLCVRPVCLSVCLHFMSKSRDSKRMTFSRLKRIW